MKNKSTIAKLLASEDIFVVYKQMETAYFDSKKRELGLPIWKEEDMTKDIIDLMTCHEIGHALWTPLDMLEKSRLRKLNHSFVNILEDARIEKKVKIKYPGSVGVFNRGYAELVEKDFFGTKEKGIENFNLIDRINVFYKSFDTSIAFSDEEKVWVEKVGKTETPDEVLDLAEELYKWMEENAPEDTSSDEENGMPEKSGEAGEGESSSAAGEESEGNSDDNVDNIGSDGLDDADDNGDSDARSSDDVKDGDENGNSSHDTSDTKSDASDPDDASDSDDDDASEGSLEGGTESKGKGTTPKAETDKSFSDGLDSLRDKMANDRIYGKIPKIDLKSKIIDTDTVLKEFYGSFIENAKNSSEKLYVDKCLEELETLKKESKKTVSYMVKEFEMKKSADAYARAAVSKTGSLDMSKLHTYKYNEDIFKKVTTLPGATNHGMLLVLDWSGSMSENLKGTVAQLFNLIWFCRQTRIPFEVFAFSDRYDTKSRHDYGARHAAPETNVDFKAGGMILQNSFKMLNFFSSNMSAADEMKMMHALMMYTNAVGGGYRDWNEVGYPVRPIHTYELGGTPLNDAIVSMLTIAPKFKADTGVQRVNTIFLTDGASNRLDGVYDYKLVTHEADPDFGKHKESITPFGSGFSRNYGTDIMITDPVTNKTHKIGGNMTDDLLAMLKDRVPGMNLVGFFIAGSGRSGRVDKRTIAGILNKSAYDVMDEVKFINKNKYLAVTTSGYDEYYILPGGGSLEIEGYELPDELVGASKAKLKSAFGKSMKSRISSRQLLNKFVKLVA